MEAGHYSFKAKPVPLRHPAIHMKVQSKYAGVLELEGTSDVTLSPSQSVQYFLGQLLQQVWTQSLPQQPDNSEVFLPKAVLPEDTAT